MSSPRATKKLREVTSKACEQPENLLTITEAARVLSVDRSFVSAWVSAGSLPFVTVGCSRRIPRWALMDFEHLLVSEISDRVKKLLGDANGKSAKTTGDKTKIDAR